MNKHITPQEVPAMLVEEERQLLMWEYQSPTIPASNPHLPQTYDVHCPRYKGAYVNNTPLSERAKNWPKRDLNGVPWPKMKTTVREGKHVMYADDNEVKPSYTKNYRRYSTS